jgi:hypothetical protein
MNMKTLLKASQVLTVFCLLSTTLRAADSPFAGTWKVNVSKSKFAPGTAPKEGTLTWTPVGEQWKRVFAGIDADGNKFNQTGIIAWDGKDHAVENTAITVAITSVDDYTQSTTVKQDGAVVDSGRTVISKDGKTMTEIHDSPPGLWVLEKQ